MLDFIIIAIVLAIVGVALGYIIKAKKSGVKCIGCSVGSSCGHHCDGKCHCHEEEE